MELNPNWGGGKIVHRKGYVMVRVPEHPRVKGKQSAYVFEHILVVEDHIGRYLNENEQVHHKNGVKDDNRLKNLELWTGSHPNGCRVSDLLDWAKEIIELYG